MAEATINHPMDDGENDEFQSHNQFVRSQALILFDRTQPLHELGKKSRRIMEQAALFHHFTLPGGKKRKKPELAIRKSLQKELEGELPEEEIDILAVIIATHLRAIKRKDYDRLWLSPTQQREALTMASLLRIAAGLDDSRSQTTVLLQIEPEREQLWIVVDGPYATQDAARAQHNARLWNKIGYPEAKILKSSDAADTLLPYPLLTETVGIIPAENLSEAGRKVMRFQFAFLLANEQGTRLGEDIEALHDMRVSTRRLRAAFDVFGEAYESSTLKPYLKGLRATGRALGDVRDIDVYNQKTQKYLDTLPEEQQRGLKPLLKDREKQREAKRQQMLSYLDSQEYQTFKRQFNIFLNTPGVGARQFPEDVPIPQRVRELAPVLITSRLAAILAYDPFIAGAPIELLHSLRIEFRKLRYSVEFFREILGEPVEKVIEEFKSLQEHLGNLNDANVAFQITEAFLKENKDKELNMKPVRDYLEFRLAERQQLLENFPVVWVHFNRPELRRDLFNALAVL